VKEHLAGLIQSASSPIAARNLAREYLQALVLQSLQRAGAMTSLAFHGGTALRFLYSLPRYSEDLDFALDGNAATYNFRAYLQAIQKDLRSQGYDVALKTSDKKTIHNAFVRFNGLPYELDLSPHRDETLAVKLEVDTKPPKGAGLEVSLVRRHVLLHLHHHDKASLLTGKLHAILQRPFLKGRDVYDLIWYLSDKGWPPPNLTLLNNALAQKNWDGETLTVENWRRVIRARVESFSWEQAVNDVLPFLASQQDVALLTKENLMRMLSDK
jgi:hypothetical protein